MRKMKLRAFEITNKNIGKVNSGLIENLQLKLKESVETGERRMVLNSDEENPEEDLISHHNYSNNIQFCTMLRIAPGKDVQHINEQLFKKPSFTIADLNSSTIDGVAVYKEHYYFGVAGDYIVTTLRGNIPIIRLQTYLNWYLNQIYDINPVISKSVSKELSDVKSVTVMDPVSRAAYSASPTGATITPSTGKSILNLTSYALEKVKDMFVDAPALNDVDLANLISAKLIIEFSKPKKNDSEAVKKAYAALLKPMTDIDHVQLNGRDGKSYKKGSDILRTKTVDIDLTESGNINENTLMQSMAAFILELENEKKTPA